MEAKEKALDKIRKLLALAEDKSASEGEIENALKAAQNLMAKYSIEAGDIDISSSDISEIETDLDFKQGEMKTWLQKLCHILAENYGCSEVKFDTDWTFTRTWKAKATKSILKIYGTKEDILVVKTIYERTIPIIRNLANKRFREYSNEVINYQLQNNHKIESPVKSTFFNNYVDGFLDGLRTKLRSQKEKDIIEDNTGNYGLILVKKEDLVKSYINENVQIKTGKWSTPKSSVPQAYIRGKEDGSVEHSNKIG